MLTGPLPASTPLYPLCQRLVPGSVCLTATPWWWRQARSHCPNAGGGLTVILPMSQMGDQGTERSQGVHGVVPALSAGAGSRAQATRLQGLSPRGQHQASPGEMGLGHPPAARAPVLPPPHCEGVWTRLLFAGKMGEGQRHTISTRRVTAGALRRYLLLHRLGTAITGPGQTAHEQCAHSGCSGQWGCNGRRPCGVIGTHAVPHAVTHFLQPKKSLTESCQVRWGQEKS